jgi:hypothetical protein
MKLFFIFFFLFFLNSCSFDNKTGIWNNDKVIKQKDKIIFKDFKKIAISQSEFNKEINFNENFILKISDPIVNKEWSDIFYDYNNNTKNFKYNDLNQIIFKSNKLSKYSSSKYKLYEDGNIIISDEKGNIIVFSTYENKIISKFNFYKKMFKGVKKNLNFIVEDNIIFVTDNLGYFYAYNYNLNKILWAKNFKVPFRSNLKIYKKKVIASNQNNNLLIINKNEGELLKLIPTEEISLKNEFINNLSIYSNNLLFLNTFGSLYSINLDSLSINWFNNFNQSFDLSPTNLFLGNKIIVTDEIVIISSNLNTFFINLNTGSVLKKYNFSTKKKPVALGNLVFFLTNNNFLIAVDLKKYDIVFSLDISKYDKSLKNSKNEIIRDIMILNNEIFIFLENSYVLKFSLKGIFKQKIKLPLKINTFPVVLENSIFFLDKKNKLIILN